MRDSSGGSGGAWRQVGRLLPEILPSERRASSGDSGGVVTCRIWIIEKLLENLAGGKEQI